MLWFSMSGFVYFIDNIILPLASSVVVLSFLLFLGRQMRQDKLDIFNSPRVMNPKDARSYLKKVQKEKIEKEFDTLCKYGRLKESDDTEYLKLREKGVGIKEAIDALNPQDF